MFRRRGGNSSNDVGNQEGSLTSPHQELSSLMDKLEESVESSMNLFVDSLIANADQNKEGGEQRGNGILNRVRRFRRGSSRDESVSSLATTASETRSTSEKTTTSSKSAPYKYRYKQSDARFIPMDEVDKESFVETLRRISELVVIGERAAAKVQDDEAKLRSLLRKENETTATTGSSTTTDGVANTNSGSNSKDPHEVENLRKSIAEKTDYATLFDYFFERNGLAIFSDILTGKAFNLQTFVQKRIDAVQEELKIFATTGDQDKDSKTTTEKQQRQTEKTEKLDSILKSLESLQEMDPLVLLPPLAVSIQGFQSTSILVQNVKRATSLFFILSNNHINQLIGIPLEEYHIAEREKFTVKSDDSTNTNAFMSPRRFASPELGELTTTFVSFLKSLALRMNAETLQFFLTYPSGSAIESDIDYLEEVPAVEEQDDDDEERPIDEVVSNAQVQKDIPINRPIVVKTIQVEFPLYERALEFCSAHHDSFVRTTAMNVCLNTLRLTTVEAKTQDEDPGEVVADVKLEPSLGDSPDGVLHNAKPLPIRERLAIAQYVCTPSRLEKLASPIFTKLAQLWGLLEEQFRDMELASKEDVRGDESESIGSDSATRRPSNDKIARAREIARRKKFTGIFNDTSYNLQDELLLLEDMLKVGLTSLNEQVVEMMFATFVYPLLLQPLLLYFQRSPVTAEVLFADTLKDHTLGNAIKQSDATATEKAVISAPAKSALFCLSATFQFLNNSPLVRLLFTAVFHPLSPDATGETMIRAKADVACIGCDGKPTIRIDRVDENGKMICESDRETYVFGTVTGRKEMSGRRMSDSKSCNDTCVFVLAPALSEILSFKGTDGSLVARSRHNPYRKAIFQCLTLNREVSDLQDLAVMAVYTAVSKFEGDFLFDLLYGLDIKQYRENLPKNKRFDIFRGQDKYAADFEDQLDDRGIGGSASSRVDSRLSLSTLEGGKIGFDYTNQVISSFQCSILNASPGGKGAWKLKYDRVAANALLLCVRGNSEAITRASEAISRRYHDASAFLADVPATIDVLFDSGKLWGELKNTLPVNSKESETQDLYYGAIMDMIVRRSNVEGSTEVGESILNHMFYLTNDITERKDEVPIYVSVSSVGSYGDLGARASTFSASRQGDLAGAAFENAVGSTSALLKLNALVSLLVELKKAPQLLLDQKLGGLNFKQFGNSILTNLTNRKTIFSPISERLDNAIFGIGSEEIDSLKGFKSGSTLSLADKMAFPCVCEVPPSMAPLFSKEGAKVVSQGITWQSLYLVVIDANLLLVEPERRSKGNGRVVTACRLENLKLDKDPDNARVDTSARRLILINESPDLKPPGLFRYEKKLRAQHKGPFSHVKRYKSSLDVWFEDSNALKIAFSNVFERIVISKADRGNRIRQYLSQGNI